MSSLNQAFIKAYGKDAAPTVATDPTRPAPANETAPAARVIDSWYAADAWYRAEAAPSDAAHAPVPPPHAAFTSATPARPAATAYVAPAAGDLKKLARSTEESDYRLRPPEPISEPELIVDEAPARATPKTATAKTARPVTTTAAPVTYETTPPADAFSLQQMYAPVQVVSGWAAALSVPAAPVKPQSLPTRPATERPAPKKGPTPEAAAVKPPVTTATKEAAQPKVAEKPAVSKPVVAPPPVEKPAARSAAPVAQMRLDAAIGQPIPKPHGGNTQAPVAPPAPATPPRETAPVKIQPAWEVDRFQWPEHCRQLLAPEQSYMSEVGARLASAAKDGLSILAITSTRRGEGRTTLALCLARAAAETGLKVALVDADADNPQLVNELGVEASCGWHDVVVGKQPLSEAAILSLEEKFTLFPWTAAGAIKSLNDPQVTRVLKQIAAAYDLVILDLGPAPGRETRLFEDGENCPVDAAILVRDVRWTSALEAQRVAAQLVSAGVESVGIAENFGPRNSG